jgi:DNA polymerase-3 subunit gamma/tau
MLRAQLAVVLNGRASGISPVAMEALEKHRDTFAAGDLLRMLSTLAAIEPQFRKSAQQQLLVEMLLVRFALLDRTVSLEEVLETLGGEGGSRGGTEKPKGTERGRPPADQPVRAQQASAPADVSAADWKSQLERTASSPERPARLTNEGVREERLRMLRAQDPVLDAAVRELDLDLLD